MVWTPKYRLKILEGEIATEVSSCIRAFSAQKECEVNELNVQIDHVHLVAMVPPKLSIFDYKYILWCTNTNNLWARPHGASIDL